MDRFWISKQELNLKIKNKKVILWGRSEDWVHKTLLLFGKKKIKYIVDKNLSYEGKKYKNIKIYNPKKLLKENLKKIYIVITAGPYISVIKDLEKMKMIPGENFCCTPVLFDWAKLREISNYKKKIFFTSNDYDHSSNVKRKSKLGGGLFILDTLTGKYKKKISGQLRQVIKFRDKYLTVDHFKQELIFFNSKGNIKEKIFVGRNDKPNLCGLSTDNDLIFMSNAGSDVISIFDYNKKKIIKKIHFSNKKNLGSHHINDIAYYKGSLFVSYFSYTGNWRKEVFDGGVSKLDIKSKKKKELLTKLWMPHSISIINNKSAVLNSMEGELILDNKVCGKFPGFIRGLAYDGKFFFIGQSETMYMSRLFKKSKNIMCNAGIYIFDNLTKASRFYGFNDLMNIHDIQIIDN